MPRLPLAFAAAALLALALSSCDSGGSDDDDNGGVQAGTFPASVEGQISTTLSGTAISTCFGGTWGIVLASGEQQTVTFTTSGVGRPGPGTYVIRRNDLNNPVLAGEFFGSLVLEAGPSWFVRFGTLTVT